MIYESHLHPSSTSNNNNNSNSLNKNNTKQQQQRPNSPHNSTNNKSISQNPASSSSSSKLHQYFASSEYLSQQQELCMFIAQFPIINLDQIKSINEILPLLIKQNQMLANKTQQQITMMKQSFIKHQNLSKQTRQTKRQMEKLKQFYDEKLKQLNQKELRIDSHSSLLISKIEAIEKMVLTQSQIIKLIMEAQYKKCQDFVNERKTRLEFQDYQEEVSSLNQLLKQLYPEKTSECHLIQVNDSKQQCILDLSLLEKSCRQIKKRQKHFSKVKGSVEDFCHRLNKIVQVVPADVLAQQFKYQTDNFMQIVSELIGERSSKIKSKKEPSRRNSQPMNPVQLQNSKNLSSMGSESSLGGLNTQSQGHIKQKIFYHSGNINNASNQQKQNQFFQQLLLKVHQRNQNTIQETKSRLQSTIHQLQSQFSESRQYYQNYLINLKMQYENQKRTITQELTVKTETSKHYQECIEKYVAEIEDLKNKVQILTRENQQAKDNNKPLEKQVENLKGQIEGLMIQLNREKQKLKGTLHQAQDMHSAKYKQLNQLFEKEKQLRNKNSDQLQQTIAKAKKKYNELQDRSDNIEKENRKLRIQIDEKQEIINSLERKVQNIEKEKVNHLLEQLQNIEKDHKKQKLQTKAIVKANAQLSQQNSLNQTLIKELQAKLAKKEQNIKVLNTKLSTENISKRQVTQKKNQLSKTEKQCEQLQKSLKKQKEENSKLKSIIKQMKKQLEQVYLTLNELKEIEIDRERLIIDAQKSERWKENIMKNYDQMKYQILKVESENKNLALQVKHYKSALKRIQVLK